MPRLLIRIISTMLIGAMLILSSGCFASFNLTRKVYNFNKSVGDKWVNEVVFLVMTIIPVYGIAATIDVLILNSIEFWSGSNPVSASNHQRVVDLPDGVSITLNNTERIVTLSQGNGATRFVLERVDGETVVKDADGRILTRCTATDEGGMVVKDAAGTVISNYSNTDLQRLAEKLSVR